MGELFERRRRAPAARIGAPAASGLPSSMNCAAKPGRLVQLRRYSPRLNPALRGRDRRRPPWHGGSRPPEAGERQACRRRPRAASSASVQPETAPGTVRAARPPRTGRVMAALAIEGDRGLRSGGAACVDEADAPPGIGEQPEAVAADRVHMRVDDARLSPPWPPSPRWHCRPAPGSAGRSRREAMGAATAALAKVFHGAVFASDLCTLRRSKARRDGIEAGGLHDGPAMPASNSHQLAEPHHHRLGRHPHRHGAFRCRVGVRLGARRLFPARPGARNDPPGTARPSRPLRHHRLPAAGDTGRAHLQASEGAAMATEGSAYPRDMRGYGRNAA